MSEKLIITQRELDEIYLAHFYSTNLAHGTDGHNRLILIAKLARHAGIVVDENGNFSTFPSNIDVVENLKR